ncbi:MAG: DUF262 domain-containing protein [Aestuariivita sp.]|nr:DUF262 domain-containing protein [Aestuariivita sp.]
MGELEILKDEIVDLENIDDLDEAASVSAELFSISSFGVDYPVETLVNRMNKGLFYIPHFQRNFVWSQNQASRFIESLLIGLPVPGIFLFQEANTGKHLVIDGQQRLTTLCNFYNGVFNEHAFKLTGLDSDWNELTYDILEDSDRARLDDAVVHATVFKQDLPQGEMNSIYEVFERINTGGVKLSPQEIRSCICHGSFNEFLHDLNENADWRTIYGPKSKRLKDIELILRFFAFYEKSAEYQSPMKHFLNDYMKSRRDNGDDDLARLQAVFENTFRFIREALGDRPFRPDRSLNTAVFDAVSSALALKLHDDANFDTALARSQYENLLSNDRFIRGYVRATADPENVRRRMEEARTAFGVR